MGESLGERSNRSKAGAQQANQGKDSPGGDSVVQSAATRGLHRTTSRPGPAVSVGSYTSTYGQASVLFSI